MMPARLTIVVLGALALGALVACEKFGETGNTCKSTGAITVDATDAGGFLPASLTVQPSQRVCWQNLGSVTHTLTSDFVEDSVNVTLPPEFTFTKGFGKITDFPYHCDLHPSERGVVQVR